MKLEIVATDDGSQTLYVPWLDEHYHSIRGAVTEAMHVFINAGFCHCGSTRPVVFEAGFGTGLNALLTAVKSIELNRVTEYYSIEKYPLTGELTEALNYKEIAFSGAGELFMAIHEAQWNTRTVIGKNFILHKIEGDLLRSLPECKADVIYYDAFSPSRQPELWEPDVLTRVVSMLGPGGIFVTYSARGEVKRTLMKAGLMTELLAGAAGKRHMLRAVKL